MRRRILYSLIGPLVFLLVWELVYLLGLVNRLFFPAPLEVLKEIPALIGSGGILNDALATLARTASGFLLGALVGIPIGMLLGLSERLYRASEFVIDFFRSLPSSALFPVFMLFFGIGDRAKIFLSAFACCLLLIVHTAHGIKNRNPTKVMVARMEGASSMRVFTKVVLPDALPEIATGLRLSVSLALILIVVTEMFIGTTVGLGRRIMDAQLTYRIPEMYGAIMIAGVLGYVLNKGVGLARDRWIHWGGKS